MELVISEGSPREEQSARIRHVRPGMTFCVFVPQSDGSVLTPAALGSEMICFIPAASWITTLLQAAAMCLILLQCVGSSLIGAD